MSVQVRIDRPEDKEVYLSESQNLFRKPSEKIKFIANSYLLYFITFIPAIILVLITSQNSMIQKFIKKKEEFIILSALLSLAIGFGLAFSKIFARKQPLNFISYVIYLIAYAITLSGISVEFDFQLTIVFLVFMALQSFGGLIYSAQNPKYFAVRQGIFFVFGFLLIPFIAFGFVFKKKIFEISLIAIMVALTGTFILFTSRLLVRNKNFQMLPEDFIMGAMKYATILPLLAEVSVEQLFFNNVFKQKKRGEQKLLKCIFIIWIISTKNYFNKIRKYIIQQIIIIKLNITLSYNPIIKFIVSQQIFE